MNFLRTVRLFQLKNFRKGPIAQMPDKVKEAKDYVAKKAGDIKESAADAKSEAEKKATLKVDSSWAKGKVDAAGDIRDQAKKVEKQAEKGQEKSDFGKVKAKEAKQEFPDSDKEKSFRSQ